MCKIKENGLLSIGLAIFVTMTTIIIIAGGAAYYLGLFDNLKKENNGGVNPKVPEEVVNNREDVIKNNGVEIINEAKFEGLTKISVFKGKAYFLSETEGGRHTPFSTDKRLQFVLEGEEVEGVIKLLGKAEIIYPGDEVIFNVDLFTPANIAVGFKFDIKEGGRIIGNGSILELIENKKNEEDNSKVLDECKEFPDKLKICQEYECEYTD